MAKPKYINPWQTDFGALVPNWLLRSNLVSPGAKLCYGRLRQYAGKAGIAYPSHETLAAELCVSTDQARRYVRELREAGLIEASRLGHQRANRYRFLEVPQMTEFEFDPEEQRDYDKLKTEAEIINALGDQDSDALLKAIEYATGGGVQFCTLNSADMHPLMEKNQRRDSEGKKADGTKTSMKARLPDTRDELSRQLARLRVSPDPHDDPIGELGNQVGISPEDASLIGFLSEEEREDYGGL